MCVRVWEGGDGGDRSVVYTGYKTRSRDTAGRLCRLTFCARYELSR